MGINKILKEFMGMEEELNSESGTFTINSKGIVFASCLTLII